MGDGGRMNKLLDWVSKQAQHPVAEALAVALIVYTIIKLATP